MRQFCDVNVNQNQSRFQTIHRTYNAHYDQAVSILVQAEFFKLLNKDLIAKYSIKWIYTAPIASTYYVRLVRRLCGCVLSINVCTVRNQKRCFGQQIYLLLNGKPISAEISG